MNDDHPGVGVDTIQPCTTMQPNSITTNTSWIDVTQKLCQCRHRSMYELVGSQCCLSLKALALVTVNSGLKGNAGIAAG